MTSVSGVRLSVTERLPDDVYAILPELINQKSALEYLNGLINNHLCLARMEAISNHFVQKRSTFGGSCSSGDKEEATGTKGEIYRGEKQ